MTRAIRGGLDLRVGLALTVSYLGFAVAFLGSIVIARLLGPEGKGTLSLFLATAGGLSIFTGLGIGHGQMFHAARAPEKLRHFMPNALVVSLALGSGGGIGYFAVGWLSQLRIVAELGWTAVVAGVLLVPLASLITFQRQLLLTTGDYVASKLNFSFTQAAPLLAVAIALLLGTVSLEVVISTVVALHAAFFIGFQRWIAGRASPPVTLSPSAFSWTYARESLSFGYRHYLSNLALFLANRLDFFLVAWYLGKNGLGVYSVAVALAEIVLRLPSELGTILFPAFASGEIGRGEAAPILRRTLALALAIALVLGLLSEPLVILLYGEAFRNAVNAFRWLLLGTIAWSTIFVTWNHAAAGGRPGVGVPVFGAAAFLGGTLNVLLLPRLGIVAAGMVAAVSYWLVACLLLSLFCRREGCRLRDAVLVRPADVVWLMREGSRAIGSVVAHLAGRRPR